MQYIIELWKSVVGRFRKTDPGTAYEAAQKVQALPIRSRILAELQSKGKTAVLARHKGYTGHELAKLTGIRLNSITPRFKELQRQGKIKDSGYRRDGQIVWVAV